MSAPSELHGAVWPDKSAILTMASKPERSLQVPPILWCRLLG